MMPAKKHPSKELVKDLKKVFEKHNWSGMAIGLRAAQADDAPDLCPDGNPPQVVRYQLPDGTWVEKKMCL
jgi:hypothetical protein